MIPNPNLTLKQHRKKGHVTLFSLLFQFSLFLFFFDNDWINQIHIEHLFLGGIG